MVDKQIDKVKFDKIAKNIEEHISKTYGCIRFIDSYRFLSMGSDELVKTLDNGDLENLKTEFPENWIYQVRR